MIGFLWHFLQPFRYSCKFYSVVLNQLTPSKDVSLKIIQLKVNLVWFFLLRCKTYMWWICLNMNMTPVEVYDWTSGIILKFSRAGEKYQRKLFWGVPSVWNIAAVFYFTPSTLIYYIDIVYVYAKWSCTLYNVTNWVIHWIIYSAKHILITSYISHSMWLVHFFSLFLK